MLGVGSGMSAIPISLVFQNLGFGMGYEGQGSKDSMPMMVKIGTGSRMLKGRLLMGLDMEQAIDNELVIRIGSEYKVYDNVRLRCGYKWDSGGNELGLVSGIGCGFGVEIKGIGIDYSYGRYGELGDVHRVGINYRFGKKVDEAVSLKISADSVSGSGEDVSVVRSRKEVLYYGRGDDYVLPDHEIILKKIVGLCKLNPEFNIVVEGHNDIKEVNRLSRDRAIKVVERLVKLGIGRDKIKLRSYGSKRPISSGMSEEELASNRRVEILMWSRERAYGGVVGGDEGVGD